MKDDIKLIQEFVINEIIFYEIAIVFIEIFVMNNI